MTYEEAKEIESRFDELWELNPKASKGGSKDTARSYLISILARWKELSFDIIKEKYQQHVEYIDKNNYGKELRYQKARTTIEDWLENKMWEEDLKMTRTRSPKDIYLYGD